MASSRPTNWKPSSAFNQPHPRLPTAPRWEIQEASKDDSIGFVIFNTDMLDLTFFEFTH
jgi:hypothetical protein